MKLKDWIINAFSLAIIAGVYYGITFATILAWVILLGAATGILTVTYFVSLASEEIKARSRKEFTPFKIIYGLFSQVLFCYVFWVTANFSLLFAYGLLIALTYNFIYQLFKQEETN